MQINTEAQGYTGRTCADQSYLVQQIRPDTALLVGGNLPERYVGQIFATMLQGMGHGSTIHKVGKLENGRRAYLSDNTTNESAYIALQVSEAQLTVYGCSLDADDDAFRQPQQGSSLLR